MKQPALPEWLRTATDWAFVLAGLAGGLAGVIRKATGAPLKAMLLCAAKFIGDFAIGEAVGRYVAAPAISTVVGNPVELTTGRKFLLAQDEIDFVLNGRLPLTCSRFYGSNLQYEGLLGRGWMHEWDVNLRLHEGEIIHTDFQGRETAFPQIKPGQKIYTASPIPQWVSKAASLNRMASKKNSNTMPWVCYARTLTHVGKLAHGRVTRVGRSRTR